MTPVNFPQTNVSFVAPADMDESQVKTVRAYAGSILSGSLDGESMIVVAWQPNEAEIEAIKAGAPVFLTTVGRLPPHFLSTDFETATHPA